MRLIKTQKGFTIVETLIVLAVTGILFISTVILISGQVSKAQYRDTVYRVDQAINNAINDVQNGVFNPMDNSCGDGKIAGQSDCVYAGLKISITSAGELRKEYLVKDNPDTSPVQGNDFATSTSSLTTTTQLPGYVDYQPILINSEQPEIFLYVLFNNYLDNIVDAGGTQSYAIYYTVGGNSAGNLGFLKSVPPSSISGNYLCLSSGDRKAKIVIGDGGRLETEIEFESADCI